MKATLRLMWVNHEGMVHVDLWKDVEVTPEQMSAVLDAEKQNFDALSVEDFVPQEDNDDVH